MRSGSDKKKILYFIFALTLLLIWSQSALPRAASTVESRSLTLLMFGEGSAERIVRKYAHFVEYTILGAELCFISLQLLKRIFRRESFRWYGVAPLALNLGLWAAFIDETIQYFPKRAPEVKDIWIDLSGVCAGALAYFLLKALWNRFRAARSSL